MALPEVRAFLATKTGARQLFLSMANLGESALKMLVGLLQPRDDWVQDMQIGAVLRAQEVSFQRATTTLKTLFDLFRRHHTMYGQKFGALAPCDYEEMRLAYVENPPCRTKEYFCLLRFLFDFEAEWRPLVRAALPDQRLRDALGSAWPEFPSHNELRHPTVRMVPELVLPGYYEAEIYFDWGEFDAALFRGAKDVGRFLLLLCKETTAFKGHYKAEWFRATLCDFLAPCVFFHLLVARKNKPLLLQGEAEQLLGFPI
jgi:hypothetical protein